jgi:hypothetical protein
MPSTTLSDAALTLLKRRLDGEAKVTDENRPAYRELAAAGIMYPMHTFAKGSESAYRFTQDGWHCRFEFLRRRSFASFGVDRKRS